MKDKHPGGIKEARLAAKKDLDEASSFLLIVRTETGYGLTSGGTDTVYMLGLIDYAQQTIHRHLHERKADSDSHGREEIS